ncbi:hypothetical protein [Treponema sp.]|uniref:hypothetical protein n=1 Tax=Treponema sp. TaxID=166 RepID=UPI00257CB481|nr:hypothetical protein [Treponema sp.]MBE6355126.1 hypothetical protein [Treponema sp.]
MAVHAKNPTFSELMQQKVNTEVKESMQVLMPSVNDIKTVTPQVPAEPEKPVNMAEEPKQEAKTETATKKRKDVLIGIHVTDDERNELRKMFCSNGFSLATAYRAAMTYLRQDIELGKAYITSNGELIRKG